MTKLTEEEIGQTYREGWANNQDFARAIEAKTRNHVLEEVAQEFDKMTALGDTAASFARFVRDMKR